MHTFYNLHFINDIETTVLMPTKNRASRGFFDPLPQPRKPHARTHHPL